MYQPLVAIIIPVYNVEQYLSRCIDSLLQQSYANIEIILVNDGSKDNSGNICDTYAMGNQRIKVIHKQNGGLSDARNVGLDRAMGQYLTFVDSDDFVHKDYVLNMMKACVENDCEIVQCSFEKGQDNKFSTIVKKTSVQVFDHSTIFRGRKLKIIACGKLYKRSLFSTLRFPVGKINEDEFITYKVIYTANKIAVLEDVLYYYYQSQNSIMRNNKKEVRLDFIEAYEERIAFFQRFEEKELVALSKKELALRAMLYYMKNKSDDVRSNLLRICKENSKVILFDNRVPLIEKLMLNVFLLAPKLSSRCANIMLLIWWSGSWKKKLGFS